ncbi:hypothetical protein [Bacillus sp. AFS040349]|uniref:hypothetical protein n=1 Tax=Bacillus sp. AFS040349 TaxID=2033502 RepID=UPI000BFD3719|nr:hypothetical protein [Bacillus sp. AFS040349]PGT82218.1 hypothetical protein COD11_15595 [Bacillus sp. AFS040349]
MVITQLETISYLELFQYYQEIQEAAENNRELLQVRQKIEEFIIDVFNKYGEDLLPDANSRENFISNCMTLGNPKLEKQYMDLRIFLNAGNLRTVVHNLYSEEGLSAKELAKKVGFTEKEILDLTQKGIVTHELLDAICSYFNILKTPDFVRYTRIS